MPGASATALEFQLASGVVSFMIAIRNSVRAIRTIHHASLTPVVEGLVVAEQPL